MGAHNNDSQEIVQLGNVGSTTLYDAGAGGIRLPATTTTQANAMLLFPGSAAALPNSAGVGPALGLAPVLTPSFPPLLPTTNATPIAPAINLLPLQPPPMHHHPLMNMVPTAISLHPGGATLGQFAQAPFFAPLKRRSGKWIPEEEEYALLLVTLFEKGLLTDCESGATLRSYLSQKLQCVPMRISKKFAGKGIGKMVYSSNSMTVDQLQSELMQRIKKAEQRFLEAIQPATGFVSVSILLNFIIAVSTREM
jgi:hypothetical protein